MEGSDFNMIGVIPAAIKTYEVEGSFDDPNPEEGKIYYRPKDGRLYYYSKIVKRPNPDTGYFPIWDGSNTYSSAFAKKKYIDTDVKMITPEAISKALTKDVADDIRYRQRRATADQFLKPRITDSDNSLTQCIKGAITNMDLTIVDLYDGAKPHLDEEQVNQYYSSLNKITLMRLVKFNIWCTVILHVKYEIIVYNKKRKVLTYYYPEDKFDTGIVNYGSIIKSKADSLKRIAKILMISQNISKQDLREGESDDYTVNNLMTTINGDKPLSAQLFSRFIRLAHLRYQIKIYDMKGKQIFVFKE